LFQQYDSVLEGREGSAEEAVAPMEIGEGAAAAAAASEVNAEDVGCCFPGLAAKSKEKMKKLWQVTKDSFRESARAYKKL
jgi:tRNA(Ile2) C34 agmatinyltransferase TiaS